jgi:putative ABC transport system permease protein
MSRSQRIARDVLASLSAQRSRVLLMMLGLTVGVAVLSAVIVIGQGTRERIMGLVEKHGLDMVMVRAGGEVQVFAPHSDRGLASLVEADARAIEAEVPYVDLVSAVQNLRGINVVYEGRSVVTRAFGVEPSWLAIRHRDVAEGEFLSESDMAAMARVAVIGVFIELGTDAAGIDDWDDRIVVPLTTSARRLFNRPYLEQIVFRVTDVRRVPETAERVRDLLTLRHGIGPGQPADFFVREPEDVEGAALEASSTLSALLLAISLVALVAGGLVIMNLMLASVSQRSREIGLRRAMGARASDISRQFLLESLFVALAGGTVGVAAGIAIAAALGAAGMASSRITWVPFAVALVACIVIGVAFGIHPARKAARVDPAASLRGRAA